MYPRGDGTCIMVQYDALADHGSFFVRASAADMAWSSWKKDDPMLRKQK